MWNSDFQLFFGLWSSIVFLLRNFNSQQISNGLVCFDFRNVESFHCNFQLGILSTMGNSDIQLFLSLEIPIFNCFSSPEFQMQWVLGLEISNILSTSFKYKEFESFISEWDNFSSILRSYGGSQVDHPWGVSVVR